jgi:hypothetical protein
MATTKQQRGVIGFMVSHFAHRMSHRFGWHPCDLLEVVHEPNCPGFCTLDPPNRDFARCDVKLRLKCRVCGEEELI